MPIKKIRIIYAEDHVQFRKAVVNELESLNISVIAQYKAHMLDLKMAGKTNLPMRYYYESQNVLKTSYGYKGSFKNQLTIKNYFFNFIR